MDEDRLIKEQVFHNERFASDDANRKSTDKYYSVNEHVNERYIEIVSQHCNGKRLLEYGCGTGSWSEEWLKKGAILTGIDISQEGIKKAQKRISDQGLKAEFYVRNAENTELPAESFDIIAGTGIIHHLDLKSSFNELRRLLKHDGHAVFMEPLGHNPFIQLYRALTPKMRTEDEHPLKISDFQLLRNYFNNVNVEFYSMFTLLGVPFRNSSLFSNFYKILQNTDKLFFKALPFTKRYAWTVVIHASNPKKK